MAIEFSTVGRTAKILKDYQAVTRTGRNGEWESKSVMFSLAVDRDYKQMNDKGELERHTDFIPVRATGPIAECFNKYCNDRNEEGKLVSRLIQVSGHVEQYDKERTERIELGGQQYDVTFNETNKTIFVAEKIKFLDAPKKKAEGQSSTGVKIKAVDNATASAPVAVEAPAEDVAPF